jgi:hypothetical protein
MENGRATGSVGVGPVVGFVGGIAAGVVLTSSPRPLEPQAATILRTEVSGDRGLPFPTVGRAAVGRWGEDSGVRGRALRRGTAGSLGGGGGGSVEAVMEDFRGELGRALGFVGDAEREEVIEGTFEARGNELILSATRRFEENPPGAEAERGEKMP